MEKTAGEIQKEQIAEIEREGDKTFEQRDFGLQRGFCGRPGDSTKHLERLGQVVFQQENRWPEIPPAKIPHDWSDFQDWRKVQDVQV